MNFVRFYYYKKDEDIFDYIVPTIQEYSDSEDTDSEDFDTDDEDNLNNTNNIS
jgi:hypothetical protein